MFVGPTLLEGGWFERRATGNLSHMQPSSGKIGGGIEKRKRFWGYSFSCDYYIRNTYQNKFLKLDRCDSSQIWKCHWLTHWPMGLTTMRCYHISKYCWLVCVIAKSTRVHIYPNCPNHSFKPPLMLLVVVQCDDDPISCGRTSGNCGRRTQPAVVSLSTRPLSIKLSFSLLLPFHFPTPPQ